MGTTTILQRIPTDGKWLNLNNWFRHFNIQDTRQLCCRHCSYINRAGLSDQPSLNTTTCCHNTSTESSLQLQTHTAVISNSQESSPLNVLNTIPLLVTMNQSDCSKLFSHLEQRKVFQVVQKQKHDGTIKKRVINNTLPSVPLTSPITDDSYVQ